MAATTWAALKDQGVKGLIVLAEVNIGIRYTSWTLTAAQTVTYEAAVTQYPKIHNYLTINSVRIDGATDLTAQSSIATVESNPGSYWFDATVDKLYVSMPTGAVWTHTVIAESTLYFSSGRDTGDSPLLFGTPQKQYWPRILNVGTITRTLGPIYEPKSTVGTVSMSLAIGTDYDNLCRTYFFENREVKILLGGESLPYNEYQEVFNGFIRDFGIDLEAGAMGFELVDAMDLFNSNAVTAVFEASDFTTAISFTNCRDSSDTVSITPTTIEAGVDTGPLIGTVKPIYFGVQDDIALLAMATKNDGAANGEGVFFVSHGGCHWISEVQMDTLTGSDTFGPYSDMGEPSPDVVDLYWNSDRSMIYVIGSGSNPFRFNKAGTISFTGAANSDDELISNPVDIVKHVVDLRTDLTQTVTEDTTLIDEYRFNGSLMNLAPALTSRISMRTFLENVAASSGSHLFVTKEGKIALRVWAPDLRASTAKIVEARGDILSFSASVVAYDCFPKVFISDQAGTEYPVTYDEGRAELRSENSQTVSSTYINQPFTAEHLGRRLCRWGTGSSMIMGITTTLRHADLDLGDVIDITKTRLPVADSTYTVSGMVTSISLDIQSGTMGLVLEELRVSGRQGHIAASGSSAWASATADEKRRHAFLTDDSGTVVASDNEAHLASLEW